MQMQKLKPLCWEHRAVNVFLLKLGVGQNTSMHALPAAWNFLLVIISTRFTYTFVLYCLHFLNWVVVNAVSPADPRNKTGNIANRHDQLKQIPASIKCCVFAVDCVVSRIVIQPFTYDLVTHVLSWYTQLVKVWFVPRWSGVAFRILKSKH